MTECECKVAQPSFDIRGHSLKIELEVTFPPLYIDDNQTVLSTCCLHDRHEKLATLKRSGNNSKKKMDVTKYTKHSTCYHTYKNM